MQDLTLDDIIAMFYRHRRLFVLVVAGVFALSLLFALNFSRYRAIVTVQIEQPVISSAVTKLGTKNEDNSVSTLGLADRRIAQIEQRVTSTDSLMDIIKQLDLYPGARDSLSPEKLTAIMRKKINLDFVSSTISNPAAAQKESVEQLSALAFTVSFDYNDPVIAKKGLDAIVERFIAEEQAQRKAQSEETTAFLDDQLKQLAATIKEQEAKIAEFRAKNGESGPSAVLFNQQASLSNSMSLQAVEGQLSAAESTAASLRTQLAGTSPYSSVTEDGKQVMTEGSQLHTLQSQLASLQSRYGPQHPDVLKTQEQIRALEAKQTSPLKRQNTQDADNPVYLNLQSQLSAAQAQVSALRSQRAALVAQQNKFSESIAKNPMIEQEMSQLSLDLDNAKERFRVLKEKRLASEMNAKLESGPHGERLKIIIPSTVPESTSPKRILLIIGGLFLACFSGIGAVAALEIISQSVRSAQHLTSLIGVAPLVSIPHISSGSTHG